MKKIKYVIFDCDGVLIDSEILASKVEVEIKNKLGFPITKEEQIEKFMGLGSHHATVKAELARLPQEYLKMVNDRYDEVFKKELQPIAGVISTLEQLKLPKCVASSSEGDWLDVKLTLTNLKQFFPGSIFHGQLVKKSKPAPDLFLHAISTLGWNAEECLVVEDSEPGVQAGRAAGAVVCGFLGGSHIYPGHAEKLLKAGAHYLISDMTNLLRLTSKS